MTLLRLALALVAAGAVPVCPAQSRPAGTPSDRDGAPPKTYWLRVTGDRVNLRCRGDQNSVAVARVGQDAVLRAVGSEFGWHRILPPEGVFSYVSAKHIDQLSHSEGIVSVRSGRLRVRVGSLLTTLDPLRSEVQTLLERGTTVRIVGREGDWLKIEPPPGVFLHVSDKHVEHISPEVAARLRAAAARRRQAASTQPATPTTQPAATPNLSGAWGQRLLLVEAAIEAEARKPALEQEWAPAIARLQPIAAQREEPVVARLAQEWVAQLERRQADQTALRAARSINQRDQRDRARFEREMEQIRRAGERPTSRPAFTARGLLLKSYALRTGRPGPKYKLQDPFTQRVIAYVELIPTSEIDAAGFLGRYVGVRGQRKLDRALGADVIRVVQIEILKREPPARRPARTNP